MEIFQIASALSEPANFPAVLATLVDVQGSSYRRAGARLLITGQNLRLGSISGGCLESDLTARAAQLLNSTDSFDLVTYDTTSENDLLWGVGTGCHGIVKILLEKIDSEPTWNQCIKQTSSSRIPSTIATRWLAPDSALLGTFELSEPAPSHHPEGVFVAEIPPPLHVVIFGAGDDAQPLAELCQTLDWETTVSDPRSEMATENRFPFSRSVKCGPVEEIASSIDWDDHTAAVIMTHHYRYDLPLLKILAPINLPYLGLLGPKKRGCLLYTSPSPRDRG